MTSQNVSFVEKVFSMLHIKVLTLSQIIIKIVSLEHFITQTDTLLIISVF